MKRNIIIAGVGGQGILSIANIIGKAAIDAGLYLKQAEVHGMSQRGGAVQSHLRLSSSKIASDIIPAGKVDLIIALEPMESLRYLPMLSKEGWLITNTSAFVNIPNYPPMESIMDKIHSLPRKIALDAHKIAKHIGILKSVNIVILGASAPFLQMDNKLLENSIGENFKNKGDEIVRMNLKAYKEGMQFTIDNHLFSSES